MTSAAVAPVQWTPVLRAGRRGDSASHQRLVQAAAIWQLQLGSVVHLGGRRRTGLGRLLDLARTGQTAGVLLLSIEDLAATPEEALAVSSELAAFVAVRSLSPDEAWVETAGTVLGQVAEFVKSVNARKRAAAAKRHIAHARNANKIRIGRPRRHVPEEAILAAIGGGIGMVSRATGIPRTTLRRAIRAFEASRQSCLLMKAAEHFSTRHREGHDAQQEAVPIEG